MPEPDELEFKPVEERTLLEVGSDSQPSAPGGIGGAGLDTGRRFGQVRITGELGQGGMGKVFKGRHEGLDKDVAVKVMSEQLAADSISRQRFLREARTAAKLDHPNIVRVLDVNEQGNVPYIVLEFVDGEDLSEMLKRHGRLNSIAALRAIAQVAEGLAHAHAEGIVHRDIKPHNLFASKDGRVKLGDFGLARAVEHATEITMPGAAIGTAHYMSPEQSSGQDVDLRSDIYSLGVTAYHLLTGAPPYSGTTPVSIAVQHVNNDVPYDRERFGHVPDAAVYLFMEMTSRDPARRPTAQQVADRLQEILRQITGDGSTRLTAIGALTAAETAIPPTALSAPPLPQAQAQVPLQPNYAGTPPPGPPPPVGPLPVDRPGSSNTLLWVALGILGFFALLFGGCMMVLISG